MKQDEEVSDDCADDRGRCELCFRQFAQSPVVRRQCGTGKRKSACGQGAGPCHSDEVVVAEINDFNAGGTNVGFVSRNPDNSSNTFTIAALSSVAFRPVQIDPGTEGGQEGPQGVLIPDRNTSDGKFNGSCVIKWVGGSGLVQGQVVYVKTSGNTNGQQEVVSYAHLLPTGVSSGE